MIPISNSYYYKQYREFTFNWVNENTAFSILNNPNPDIRPASFWVKYLISLRIAECGMLNTWAVCSAIYRGE